MNSASHLPTPRPVAGRFLTPGVLVLMLLAINGMAFLFARFFFGIGCVTNLDNQYPWGLWIAVDVATGVALAAGGFTSAAIGHVMHRQHYHVIIRPALLTAMLGYTFVALGVVIDIGRPYFIWHPLIYWNGNSALFEVGICVMAYITVLYVEFLPIVTERFIGRVRLPRPLGALNKPVDRLLVLLDRALSKVIFSFIIAGVVLSCLHQSSLGTLMMIAGPKMHPLWQTPILPLLFLLSAIAVGFPMVIVESLIASWSLGLRPERAILSRLSNHVSPLLGFYLAFRIGDMVIRETFVHLGELTVQSVLFVVEVLFGVIVPLRMFFSRAVRRSMVGIFVASALVVFGIALNRMNTFITAYTPSYSLGRTYFPSIGEISVTLGLIAFLALLYKAIVMIFSVISAPSSAPPSAHTIRRPSPTR